MLVDHERLEPADEVVIVGIRKRLYLPDIRRRILERAKQIDPPFSLLAEVQELIKLGCRPAVLASDQANQASRQ